MWNRWNSVQRLEAGHVARIILITFHDGDHYCALGTRGWGPTLIPQLHSAIIPSLVTDPISVMILLMDTCYCLPEPWRLCHPFKVGQTQGDYDGRGQQSGKCNFVHFYK